MGIESAFELFPEVVEKRVNADEEVAVKHSIDKAADNASAGEAQNVDEGTNGSNCKQDHHRLDSVVIALKVLFVIFLLR